jgi:hypothetical protein
MTSYHHERRLKQLAEDLLADERIAGVLSLFDDHQPVAPEWPHARRRRSRLASAGLVALTVLLGLGMVTSVIIAAVTGVAAFAIGLVLMVPAFLLFGNCCQGNAGSRSLAFA